MHPITTPSAPAGQRSTGSVGSVGGVAPQAPAPPPNPPTCLNFLCVAGSMLARSSAATHFLYSSRLCFRPANMSGSVKPGGKVKVLGVKLGGKGKRKGHELGH